MPQPVFRIDRIRGVLVEECVFILPFGAIIVSKNSGMLFNKAVFQQWRDKPKQL